MATLGVKWRQSDEFARASLRSVMFDEDLTLPEKDFNHFREFLLNRIGNMVRIFQNKPMFNNPMIRFLWVMFNRLDERQRKAIEDMDEGNVIQAWRNNVACHLTELEYMANRSNWREYWSVKNYLLHVHNIVNMEGVELVSADKALAIYLELTDDPKWSLRPES
jgi:hypothetical protein